MARHTTMRVGGPADLLVIAHDTTSLVACVRLARARGVPLTIVGRGSDLIVMASHGRRGLSRLLLGSQANRVVTHSSVPVLICR